MLLNYSNASKLLFEFENSKFEKLRHIQTKNWNAWRVVKTSVFFNTIYSVIAYSSPINKKSINVPYQILFAALKTVIFLFKLVKIFYLNVFTKDLVVFVTLSANKTYIDNDGKVHDVMVDHFIESGIVKNYCYIEIPDNHGRHLLPCAVKSNFLTTEFSSVITLLSKIISRASFVKEPSKEIAKTFNAHFNEFGASVEVAQIEGILTDFWADYYLYLFFFKLLKPKLVVLNDQMATGRMAAAKKLRIKTIELQHGLMDEYYPQYLIHPNFKEIADDLPIADKIAVFGDFHKKQLLNKGFYTENQIFVLGKFDITDTKPTTQRFSSKKTILFITQGRLLFEQTIKDLSQLLESINWGQFFMILKLHPLEPEELVQQYQQLCLGHGENVQIIQKEFSVLEIIPVCDIILGYNSTVLLEGAAKKKAVFSLSDSICVNGMFSIIGKDDKLEKCIKICTCVDDFINLIYEPNFASDDTEDYLFKNNLLKNAEELILKTNLN